MFNKISVVGLGYIGLPTAAIFASRKIKVVGLDVNQHVVDTINRGEIHIVEPDLDAVVHQAVATGYLKATVTPEAADAFLIAVPTPFKGESHEPDLSYVMAASRAIAPVIKKGDLIVLESTSPVGTTELVADCISAIRQDLTFPKTHGEDSDIRVAHCPERVLPGHVLRELVSNDRVIGGMTPKCSAYAVKLYKNFLEGDCFVTDARTAEMTKLTENSFRDVNIAFANELSLICDKLKINVWELISLANKHPRVNILQPGPGVGGHCIAVDPWFIVSATPDEAQLIRCAREVNDKKPEWVIAKVESAINEFLMENPCASIESVAIGLYGLTFKADIDDMRESPALEIARCIAKKHPGKIFFVEPNVVNLPSDLVYAGEISTFEEVSATAHIHVLLVDHKEFKNTDLKKIAVNAKVVDTRGVW